MNFSKPNFYILTGGPGSGKTTLLKALQQDGYAVVPEVAREIIQNQMKTGGNALPWKDTSLYTQLMLEGSVKSYTDRLENNEILFFDRGIPDTLCYSALIGNGISEAMHTYATMYRYNPKVFILPPWLEIYETDNERKQNWEEAEMTYHHLKTTYEKYRYEVIDVPKTSVENRKRFVLEVINGKTS